MLVFLLSVTCSCVAHNLLIQHLITYFFHSFHSFSPLEIAPYPLSSFKNYSAPPPARAPSSSTTSSPGPTAWWPAEERTARGPTPTSATGGARTRTCGRRTPPCRRRGSSPCPATLRTPPPGPSPPSPSAAGSPLLSSMTRPPRHGAQWVFHYFKRHIQLSYSSILWSLLVRPSALV